MNSQINESDVIIIDDDYLENCISFYKVNSSSGDNDDHYRNKHMFLGRKTIRKESDLNEDDIDLNDYRRNDEENESYSNGDDHTVITEPIKTIHYYNHDKTMYKMFIVDEGEVIQLMMDLSMSKSL